MALLGPYENQGPAEHMAEGKEIINYTMEV